ncbi:SCP2 sterol-binding domain-containing protein [Spirillospora sp. NPDC029432]|uniref:SCP2 sterol-binding domain-containing protein n=1 Tax=Spirillospora sp. NPDC029432 TaxID=3154599 RepID=UPI00345369FC
MTVMPDLADAAAVQRFLETISGPEELRDLLDGADAGADDAAIEEFVEGAGATAVLDRLFTIMGERFVPERAPGAAGVVQWNVRTPSGVYTYHVEIRDGAARGRRGAYSGANVSLKISVADLLRVCAGRLNAVTAFTGGKIGLTGDMMFGARLSGWFEY